MSDYDVHKFYTDSTDRNGHSKTLRTYFPPNIVHTIGELVASKAVPEYRTPSDFIRDAAVHRAHYLSDELHVREIQRPFDLWRVMIELNQITERRQASEQVVHALQRELNTASTLEQKDAIRRVAAAGLDTLEEPYRSQARLIIS